MAKLPVKASLVALVGLLVCDPVQAAQNTRAPTVLANSQGAKGWAWKCCLDATEDGCDSTATFPNSRCQDNDWFKPVNCAGYRNIEILLAPPAITDTNGFTTDFTIYSCKPPVTGTLDSDPSTIGYCYDFTTAFGSGPLTSGDSDGVPVRNLRLSVSNYAGWFFVPRVVCTGTGCDDAALYIQCSNSSD
jgi:hypothetical protein